MAKILSTSRERTVLEIRNRILQAAGHEVYAAIDMRQAEAILTEHPDLDVIVVGYSMPAQEKKRLEALIRQYQPDCPILEIFIVSPEIASAAAIVKMEDGPEGLVHCLKELLSSRGKQRRA